MHNRMRMTAAMFLTKDLLLDWHLGEQVRLLSPFSSITYDSLTSWKVLYGTTHRR